LVVYEAALHCMVAALDKFGHAAVVGPFES
jgi:hypothetical protein